MSAVAVVAVGASLGGLEALQSILAGLPAGLSCSITIVQHRRNEAGSRLRDLLARDSALPVIEPDGGEVLRPGHVYLAPAGYHVLIEPGRLALSTEGPVAYARPSIDVLFESAAFAYGPRAAAVALTGASADGAEGAAALARAGGRVLVQDPTSALSPIAPRAVLARVPTAEVLPLSAIAPRLAALCEAS